jgi:carboxyl-terminal processing protease
MRSLREKLMEKDIDYRTRTAESLEELKKTARKEQYFEDAKDEFQALQKELDPDQERDIERFSDKIRQLLEAEILSRYYYQEGSIRASLEEDPVIDSTRKVLAGERYEEILAPPEEDPSKDR